MKLSAFAPVFLFSLGTLTACGGGGGDDAAPETTPDITAPVITLNGESSLTHSAGTEYTDSGATANDAIDGDVDVTTIGAVDSDVVSSYTLTYSATDAAGNASSITRTVNVVDDVAPVLVLNGVTPVAHNAGDVYTDQSVIATDNVDDTSEITITTSGEVNADVIASYTITYTATDAAGNQSSLTRTVNVADIAPPVITLNGEAVIEHNYGDAYVDAGATANDAVDGIVDATTSDTIIIDKIGSYGITYTATDDAGNVATLERVVNVADIKGPVITLNGDSTIILGQGRDYKELGATALDAFDNVAIDIPAPIEPEGTVDNTKIGQYQLTYTAEDAAGNISTLVRTIDVVEPRPFITTWRTATDGEDITIGTDSATYTYNYSVDWGDGSAVETGLVGDTSHTYINAGTYEVTISGTLPAFTTAAGGRDNVEKIININQWGDIAWLSMESAFSGSENMTSDAIDLPDLRQVSSMSDMFNGAVNFNADIRDWNVSSVTDMSDLFYRATSFNQDISVWDVSSVIRMQGTFGEAASFNQNISAWDVSLVTNMRSMFESVAISTSNYDALLNSWSKQVVESNVTFDAGNSQYSASSQAARDILTSAPNNWTITDGGEKP
jgi:hypothetical protein